MKDHSRYVGVVSIAVFLVAAAQVRGVTLSFDYSRDAAGSDFFGNNPDAKTALEAAGSFYSSNLADDLLDITPTGGNTWNATFTNPDDGTGDVITDMIVPADTLVIFVGSYDLGGSTIGRGGPGGWGAGGSGEWLERVRSRGEGDTQNDDGDRADDFGPWGGSIAFDLDTTWHFDYATDPTGGNVDFYSVALHELAHVLGFGLSDSWDDYVDTANDEFSGPAAIAAYGSSVPLDSGESHWLEGTSSTVFSGGAAQEAAMDPGLTNGTRKLMTDLDMGGLSDVGWEVIPEPTTFLLLAAGLVLVLNRSRSRRA